MTKSRDKNEQSKIDLLIGQGDLQAAKKKTEAGLKKSPADTTLLIQRARVAMFEMESALALELLDRALKAKPKNAEALGFKGGLLLDGGESAEAERLLKKAIKLDPESSVAQFNLGRCWAKKGQYKKAEKHLKAACKLEPENTHLILARAKAAVENKDFELYAQLLAQALEIDGSIVEAWRGLAELHHLNGDDKTAVETLRAAMEYTDEDPLIQLDLADVLLTEDLAAAALVTAKLVEALPDSAEAHIKHGQVLLETNKVQEAEKCFQQAVTLEPNDCMAKYSLATAIERGGGKKALERAMPLYEEAVKADEPFWMAFHDLGIHLLREGKYRNLSKASELLERAAQIAPGLPEPQMGLALLYAAKRKYKKAKEQAQIVVDHELADADLKKVAQNLL